MASTGSPAGIVEIFKPRHPSLEVVRRHVLGIWRFHRVARILAFLLIFPRAMVGIFMALSGGLERAWGVVLAFGVSLALILANRGINRWSKRGLLRRWKKLGLEPDHTVSCKVTTGGLVISTEDISSVVAWRSIIEVWRENGNWVLLLRTGVAVFLPGRIFDSDEAEWAFMTILFDQIDPEVRANSRAAKAFEGPSPVARA